jgi:hypothetical protein
MSADSKQHRCERAELVPLYVLRALPSGETCLLEAHLTDCPECQRELQSLRPVVDAFVSWPADILRPSESMWDQLQIRIGGEALVRLAPGTAYPPHRHAGVEELFLLHGELWIDDRKLYPGDYNRGEPGAADERVWSETGCTCVLITSPSDVIS